MSLTSGQSLSFYEILGPLGAGGMGEVYLARDSRLEREVAIKVLPEELADDEERLRRFEREAKTLASLNHPNVAGIHGIDQEGDTCFLAMELVPGEDLEERLERGTLPLDEALDVCRQIAEGLEAAHEAGVVHRDLKPANVRVTPEGVVKILDFGLAKPIGPQARKSGTTSAQSDSFLVTSEGMILGTPTYMSPEQARGKPVDRRTDIWAFGCVLFECLTAKRAFEGDAFGDLIVAILEHEADLAALPAATPPRVRELIVRCLHKDPRTRLRDLGEARIVLERVRSGEPLEGGLGGSDGAQPRPAAGRRLGWLLGAIAGVAVGLSGARFFWSGSGAAVPNPQVRFTIRHPSETSAIVYSPVVAPDGSYVAYIAEEANVARLWVRELAASEPRVLPGTEGAYHVFVSPDSRFLGFYAANKMKKVAVSGGTPVEIGGGTMNNPGAVWNSDGTITYSRSWTSGLVRTQAEGGGVEELTTLDAEAGEVGHYWPTPLPGGDELLYTVYTTDGTLNRARIELFDPATGEARFVADGAQPILLASGHLLYSRAGVYELAPFDARSGTLTGPPRTVLAELPPLVPEGSSRRPVSISKNGVMAYVVRSNDPETAPRSWFWLDSTGALEALSLPAQTLERPALSPDGLLAIVRTVAGDSDIFVHDLEAGTETRITTGSVNLESAWSPDGKRLLFNSLRNGSFDVFEADPRGGGAVEQLYTRDVDVFLGGLTLDGKGLVASLSRAETGDDIVLIDLASGEFEPLVATPGNEDGATLSPDGRLVAYHSNVSGTNHVYVVPLSGESAPVKVSRNGGMGPAWTAGGSKLAFADARQVLLADISLQGGQVSAGRPAPFLKDGFPEDLARRFTGDFAITAEGDRMIIGLLDEPARAEIEVVLDGFAALGVR